MPTWTTLGTYTWVVPAGVTEHTEHVYPVQGWEWHDSDIDAYTAMLPERLPVIEAQIAELTAALQALTQET